MKISEKARRCELSPMRKFHPYAVKAQAAGKKIYQLNIGQPDIPTPEAYFQTLRDFADPVVAYMPSPGIPPLIHAIQSYYRELGADYGEEEVLITTGGSEALLFTMMSILDPGSEVIVPEPFYPNYNTFITAAGGVIRPLPTVAENGYFYGEEARFEALISDKTRAILITNPGNPTGTVLTKDQLRMLARLAARRDLWLVVDEVYREFVYSQEPLSTAGSLDFARENIVIIDSVSKRFSACGTRIGAVLSHNALLMQQVLKFCQSRLSAATIDQLASAALYTVEKGYFAGVREEYRKRRDICYQALKRMPGVVCDEPKGAFYMMARLPVDDADAFQEWLLTSFEDRGETVMFAPGGGFYATPGGGVNEIRIAYVLCCEDLKRAMELLEKGISAYNARL